MTSTRRDFFKLVIGGITVSFILDKNKIIQPTQAPATTELGKELTSSVKSSIWDEGLHRVRILDIDLKPSVARPEETNFWFTFETLDGKSYIKQVVSPRAPWEIKKMIDKTNIPIINDSVELNQLIGKEIDITIKNTTYMGRTVNQVRQ